MPGQSTPIAPHLVAALPGAFGRSSHRTGLQTSSLAAAGTGVAALMLGLALIPTGLAVIAAHART